MHESALLCSQAELMYVENLPLQLTLQHHFCRVSSRILHSLLNLLLVLFCCPKPGVLLPGAQQPINTLSQGICIYLGSAEVGSRHLTQPAHLSEIQRVFYMTVTKSKLH